MGGDRFLPRPQGPGDVGCTPLKTKEIVPQACPCVSTHVPETNFPLKNLDGPPQGVRLHPSRQPDGYSATCLTRFRRCEYSSPERSPAGFRGVRVVGMSSYICDTVRLDSPGDTGGTLRCRGHNFYKRLRVAR